MIRAKMMKRNVYETGLLFVVSAVVILAADSVHAVEVTAQVELQGAVAGSFSREVTFVATDGTGVQLKTWRPTLEFVDGRSTANLDEAPEHMEWLSAKTVHTLRRRVACVPSNGTATADFTGESVLQGGDLNGDNLVDMKDFARLRYYWFSGNDVADITGGGSTTTSDYSVLKSNYGHEGDPL